MLPPAECRRSPNSHGSPWPGSWFYYRSVEMPGLLLRNIAMLEPHGGGVDLHVRDKLAVAQHGICLGESVQDVRRNLARGRFLASGLRRAGLVHPGRAGYRVDVVCHVNPLPYITRN